MRKYVNGFASLAYNEAVKKINFVKLQFNDGYFATIIFIHKGNKTLIATETYSN